MTTMLMLGMAIILVVGVLVCLVAPGRSLEVALAAQGAPAGEPAGSWRRAARLLRGAAPLPLPVFILCAAAVVSTVFGFAGGYTLLHTVVGNTAAGILFYAFQLVAPAVGVVVCGAGFALGRSRLKYFLLCWLCLLAALLGALMLGIGGL